MANNLSNDPIDVNKINKTPLTVKPVIDSTPVMKQKKSKGSLLGTAVQQWLLGDIRGKTNDFVTNSLIPNAKRTVLELVETALHMRPTNSNSGYGSVYGGGYDPYNLGPTVRPNPYYSGSQTQQANTGMPLRQNVGIMSNYRLVYKTSIDAATVLNAMRQMIKDNSACSVGHMYQFSNTSNYEYSSYNWGWSGNDLDNVRTISVREGFMIDLPQPHAISM